MMARENPDLDNELLALLYDELPPEEAEAARARIAADPERAERLQAWQAIRAVAATLPVPEPDPQLHYDILRAARLAAAEAETPSPFWRWLQGLTLVPALAGAAAIVAAAGLTVMLTRQVDEAPIPRDNAATAVIAEMPPAANEDQTETRRGEEKLTEVPERARPEPENLKLDDAIGGFVAAGDKAGPPEPEPAPAEPAFAEPKATKPQQKGVAELKSKLDAFKDGMPAEEVADDEVVRFAEKTKKRESRAKPKAAAVADG
ncbi:MAG: hypothetical protein KC620_20955, partial [Myxococcales bacterium]|nr:hypothetical protein [Myxococcales bacterium]